MACEIQATELDFRTFDSSDCHFPAPKVPILPWLWHPSFSTKQAARFKGLGPVDQKTFFSCGRYALHHAYRLAGVGKEGSLLAPAYHCRTMLDPAIRLEGEIRLYPLDSFLNPEWDALDHLACSAGRPVRALLLTHFFGFTAPAAKIESLKQWCRSREIALIEDCSHAFVCPATGPALGRAGDYIVASPYKFFPSPDGGLLISNHENRTDFPKWHTPVFKAELRGMAQVLRNASSRHRPVQPVTDDELSRANNLALATGVEFDRRGYHLSAMYDSQDELLGGLRVSRLILQGSDIDRAANVRRANFTRLLAGTVNLPHCRPLFSSLADGVVPYMFPLYIEYPAPHFFVLKHLGMPIWRWDDMAISTCPVATDFRLRLLHLPCHQDLTENDIEWMVSTLTRTMKEIQTNLDCLA